MVTVGGAVVNWWWFCVCLCFACCWSSAVRLTLRVWQSYVFELS